MKYWIKNNYLWKYWSSVHQIKMFITKETKWHLFCCCHDNSFAASPVLIKPEILSLCLTQRPSTPANLIMFQARLSVLLLKGWKSGYLMLRIWLFIKPLKPNKSRNRVEIMYLPGVLCFQWSTCAGVQEYTLFQDGFPQFCQ